MIIKVNNLSKQYSHKEGLIWALNNINFDVNAGDFVTITGPSGSGKTTLLLTLAGLLKPTSGSVQLLDIDITSASNNQVSDFRKKNIGFVMQSFALIPYLTAIENAMLPLALTKISKEEKFNRALEVLKMVNLENRKNHLPKELSAGQQQRVAIARALVNNPSIIFADEPTGNLDPLLSVDILNVLKFINEEKGITVLMVTHSPVAAEYGNYKIELANGEINKYQINPNLKIKEYEIQSLHENL